MAVPHEAYLIFLATKGCDSLERMNDMLSEIALPPATNEDVSRAHDTVYSVLPKIAIDEMESETPGPELARSCKILGVEKLWYGEKHCQDGRMGEDFRQEGLTSKPDIKEVYAIHEDLELRMAINALLIKGLLIQEISRLLSAKRSFVLKESVIAVYVCPSSV